MFCLQQQLFFLTALWLWNVSAYLPYDLPGGPRAASFDVHRKMRREEDHQDPDLIIGQGPLHRNNGKDTNKPIAIIPSGGDRRVPLGNGSGLVAREWSLPDALPGSIDPMQSLQDTLATLEAGKRKTMIHLNEAYLACGRQNNDTAVKDCLTSDGVHLIKARLRNLNETIKVVEGMEPEARSLKTELQNVGEEMKEETLQEGEAKVILKSEAFSDREAQNQILKATELDHKAETREKAIREYVKRSKADKQAADDSEAFALLTHEEFHVRLNGIVKGISIGDQLAKSIFDRTGYILKTAQQRENSAARMSERAEQLINTTNTWSKIHDHVTQDPKPVKKKKKKAETEDDKIFKELQDLDEHASQVTNGAIVQDAKSSLNDLGHSNDTAKTSQKPQADMRDDGSVQKLHLLRLSGGVQSNRKIPFTANALAGLDASDLAQQAQQLAAGGKGGSNMGQENDQQLVAETTDDADDDDNVADPVESKDDAFEDDDEGLGIRTSRDGSRLLNMDGFESAQDIQSESSDSAENPDVLPKTEASIEQQDDVPALRPDPDASSVAQTAADRESTAPDAEKIMTGSSTQDSEASSSGSEYINDAGAMAASSSATPPIIMKFEEHAMNTDDGDDPADDGADDDLVEDNSPSLDRPPSFRGLYRQEPTLASRHFLHSSNGRENFGFQAISRALGVPVKESAEQEESDEVEEHMPSDSNFGTEVKNIAFDDQVPSEPDPGSIIRALEHNVEKSRRDSR